MSDILKNIFCAFCGLASGAVVSGGVFSFIAMIGIVPRLAQRTNTISRIPLYEDIIVISGIIGTIISFSNISLPSHTLLAITYAFFTGIFIGVLAVSLAEVLNVIPIFTRRFRILQGISFFIISMAIGKMVGSFLNFIVIKFI
ncbi:MAG: stage V sporulation protein AB [Tyzzerella sp.]|uniref:Stage V sporulation protein AB n=1 Tax=Candidatus Fimicola merdigallinarum TaxID=2840819 RepID=A0A9D9DX41_9FIRM|nr:stage V sporulation protein AB [Candidatus Fimicola merdigallinarum]